jgi:colanic acid/amylovoran biosynthesis glycosyltransferase
MSAKPVQIAYLISSYPAISMTFILREIVTLRQRGFRIETASINAAHNSMTDLEKGESARTFYIKEHGLSLSLGALFWFMLRRPLALFSGLRKAIALGHFDAARTCLCMFYLIEAMIVARWMQRHSLSHLHVHFASQAASVGLLTSYLIPISLSLTVHGPDEFYDVPGYFLEAKMKRSKFVVCISFFARSQLMKVAPGRYWNKFDISRLGVDTNIFAPRELPAESPLTEILCIARLASTKGQRILIEALAKLIGEDRLVHLTIIGAGPDRDDLEQFTSALELTSQVSFCGSANQDEIQAYYAAADIFVLPSFAEGIPVVLMEAMAQEIPCIATAINGIPELIRDGVNGLLVYPSDVSGMANAIARLIDDPDLRRTLGSAGRERVLRDYNLEHNISHLAAIFQERLASVDAS